MEQKEFLYGVVVGALLIINPWYVAALVAVAIVIEMIVGE